MLFLLKIKIVYFSDDNTIGLLKKKTVWYILLRAIREKISYAVIEYKKNPGGEILFIYLMKEKVVRD